MTLLPIVGRELRVAARRRATHWFRFVAAAAIIGVGLLVWISESRWASPNQIGRMIFGWESSLVFAVCLFSGVFLTADCLSFEQREGTLGLLFLADLRGHDIVLGKLVSSSAQCFAGVLAMLPMMALPILLGGTTAGEFWRLTLVLLATMAWSLSIGMVVSACSRESRQTIVVTLVAILACAGLPAVGAVFLEWLAGWHRTEWLATVTPVGALVLMYDGPFHRREGACFWPCILILLLVSLLALVFASRKIPGRVTETLEGTSRRDRASVCRRRRFVRSPEIRCRWLNLNPFYWLVARDRLGLMLAWPSLLLVASVWGCFFIASLVCSRGRADDFLALSFCVAYALHALFKLLFAVEATRRFNDDRQNGALELILATPIRVEEILNGHAQALQRMFGWPTKAVLGVNIALALAIAFANPGRMDPGDQVFFLLAVMCGAVLLILDVHALLWLGAKEAMLCKRHHWAALSTFARVMASTPLGVMGIFFLATTGMSKEAAMVCFFCWFIFTAGYSTVMGANAREMLRRRFREMSSGTIKRAGWIAATPHVSESVP